MSSVKPPCLSLKHTLAALSFLEVIAEYLKKALTYEEQADLLISRGFKCDRGTLIAHLEAISYYRLSGYLYPYRNDDDSFKAGTCFSVVWDTYTFDRRFRLVVLDAIERVEVYVRSRLAYELSRLQGPFGYLDRANLPGLSDDEYDSFIPKAKLCFDRCHEPFANHFRKKYGDSHELPPYWIIVESFDFGLISKLYKGAPKSVRKAIANELGIQTPVMTSWLHAINTVRNMCAHHARLWNKTLGYKPIVPKGDEAWDYVRVNNDKVFAILSILNYLLVRIAPDTKWKIRLAALLDEYPQIDTSRMGFPVDWQSDSPWNINID